MTDAPDYDAIEALADELQMAADDVRKGWGVATEKLMPALPMIADSIPALIARCRELEAKVAGIQDANDIAAAHRFDFDRVGDQEHIDRLASLGEKPKGGPDIFYNGVQFATTRVRRAILDSKDQT